MHHYHLSDVHMWLTSPSRQLQQMPPANLNTPSDTPSLSPLRRIDANAVLAALNPSPRVVHDENSRVRASLLYAPLEYSSPGLSQSRSSRSHEQASEGRPRRPVPGRPRRNSRERELRQARDQAYGPRIPLMRPGQRQSVYDWAPAAAPAGGDDDPASRSLPPMSSDSMEVDGDSLGGLPFSVRASQFMEAVTPEGGTGNRSAGAAGVGTGIPSAESTFRMAVMQSLRNRRPRAVMSRWRDSDRTRERRDDPNRPVLEWGGTVPTARSSGLRPAASNLPSASFEVEEAIDYLSKVRTCHAPEESLRFAVRAGFNRAEDWLQIFDEQPEWDDFVLDTSFLGAAETSWLRVGGVFWGSQTTPITNCTHPSISSTRSSFSTGPSSIPSSSDSARGLNRAGSTSSATSNQWSVKVSISSVDYTQMRLTGTMEAFTDWQPNSITSITTYLEGEIIDFNKHSFRTLSFSSNLKDDANNWRKLEPFVHMSNPELVKNLVSKKFLKDLTENWVFMRWKEKCFISPKTDNDTGGLTIGGFYFLSLRRGDGRIQGYYYDPDSQPYQELTLRPRKRLFPTYEFR